MMKVSRITAVLSVCCSIVAFAAPPPQPRPEAALTEYPLSCNAAAKPLVFASWDALRNARVDEARADLVQAVAADPKCVMARALLGQLTFTAEGRRQFDEAMGQLAGLSNVEKLDLQAEQARNDGQLEKSLELAQQLQAMAPQLFEVALRVASSAQTLQRWDEMGAAAMRATQLRPESGAAWNLLGYARLSQDRDDDAVAAFRKYTQVAPREPNAHDSLADALLAADELEEAASEYQKAIDTSGGSFWRAYDGLAAVKAIQGDFDGARVALTAQHAAAPQPADKVGALEALAWTFVAQGKLPEALKVLSTAQKEAAAARLDVQLAWVPLERGQLQLAAGRPAEALRSFLEAERMKTATFTKGQQRYHRAFTLSGKVEAQARLSKTAAAQKSLDALQAVVALDLDGPGARNLLARASGHVALVRKDTKAAIEAFSLCTREDDACHLWLANAQDLAGDPAAAAATRTALLGQNHRDAASWSARVEAAARLKKAPGAVF